jgi:hypothetical protein
VCANSEGDLDMKRPAAGILVGVAVAAVLVSRIVDSLLFSGAAQQSDLEIHLHEYEANQ